MRRTLGAALLVALAACRPTPSGFTLLFLRRSPAAHLGDWSWAPDPIRSRLVAFDRDLHVVRTVSGPRLAVPMAVATLQGRYLLVSEQTGEGVVMDTAGRVVREWESPVPVALYAAAGPTIVAARSPYRVPQLYPEPDTAPLFRVLDSLGRPTAGLASLHRSALPFLAQVTNAGAVAVGPDGGGAIYFAPLVRDEIRRYSPGGVLTWTTKRGLYADESDPVFQPAVPGTPPTLNQAIVNVALAMGPDGRLYALGADDSAATELRLDVLDAASGRILETRHLGSDETAIAVDGRGHLATYDAERLLAGESGSVVEREPFTPAFVLPGLGGDTVRLARFLGKVTLVNFWASWCDPCREEFPHMAELYRAFDRTDFEIAAISDDVDGGKMRAFVRAYRPPFPILAGGGRMKGIYHYRGLPYSVLLDRHGRVIERIFGFGGVDEFRRLRETIAKEIGAP